jgi:hypothetical protein
MALANFYYHDGQTADTDDQSPVKSGGAVQTRTLVNVVLLYIRTRFVFLYSDNRFVRMLGCW